MTMLIKAGMLHTMTEQGSFTGDILVKDGRIAALAPELQLPEEASACVMDAKGLTVLPGLIDPHIHDSPETELDVLQSSHASGVTRGIFWPEDAGCCRLLTPQSIAESDVAAVHTEELSDKRLLEVFLSLSEDGKRIACEIHSAQECRRVLTAVHSTRVQAILVHLTGCEELVEAIALSGCPVVVGVNHGRTSSPWTMACRLAGLGVQLALTCNHPEAKLRHLPLCAALCVREGMDRARAMQMITTASAAIAGSLEVGQIAVGAPADLAIYDGDPLLLATSHVVTIAGGRIRH